MGLCLPTYVLGLVLMTQTDAVSMGGTGCSFGTTGLVGILLIAGSLLGGVLTFAGASSRVLRVTTAVGCLTGGVVVLALGGLQLAGCAVG